MDIYLMISLDTTNVGYREKVAGRDCKGSSRLCFGVSSAVRVCEKPKPISRIGLSRAQRGVTRHVSNGVSL